MSAPNFGPTLFDACRDGEPCRVPFLGTHHTLFAVWIRALMACLGGEEMATEEDRRDLFGLVQELAAAIEILQDHQATAMRQLLKGGDS